MVVVGGGGYLSSVNDISARRESSSSNTCPCQSTLSVASLLLIYDTHTYTHLHLTYTRTSLKQEELIEVERADQHNNKIELACSRSYIDSHDGGS